MDETRASTRPKGNGLEPLLRKAVTLAIVTVVFGWFYGWASPWAFPKNHTADFKYGVLHGALMPLSLPALVIGKDVPIYAPDNSGRGYKIGYICGINACGLLFFGAVFRRSKITSANSDKSQ
ncbi:MAG: hypothetical protein ABSG78_15785 [Verrucomicrobiota bacterium]|jgi:hypothetical protein